MKTLLSILLLFASLSTVHASDPTTYNYLTETGFASAANVLSNETTFTLTLPSSSYTATSGSLTTATAADGGPLSGEEALEAESIFQTGNSVSLTSISVFAHYTSETLGGTGDYYLRITDGEGNSFTSSAATINTNDTWDDPWTPSFRYTGKGTYTFDFSGVNLVLGDSYTVDFVDAAGNLKNANISVSRTSDLGKVDGNSTWSPILRVDTSSIIPEPSSATLSLLAFSALLLRRRRTA